MKELKKIVATTAAAILLCLPAYCQVDMVNGTDANLEVLHSLFNHHSGGNQDGVREFDGRLFDLGIESLETYGYLGAYQYRLDAQDLILQDETINLSFGLKNLLGLHLGTDGLTHRLSQTPSVDPFLEGTTAAGGNSFTNRIPGSSLELNRRLWDLGMNLTPGHNPKIRFVANWWEEMEEGSKPIVFRARTPLPNETLNPADPFPFVNRGIYGSALPIDRSTKEGTLGADLSLGKRSSLSYRYENTRFDEEATVSLTDVRIIPPLNRIAAPDTKTGSNIFKARSAITDRLFFTGSHITRSRDNSTSTLDAVGDPEFRTNSVNIDSTNLALSFLATKSLTLNGRYRRYDLDNLVPPVLDDGSIENQAVSREVTSLLLESTYTGIRRAFLRGSFERRDTNREASPLHAGHDEFEHPFTSPSTNSDIWRASFRYYPVSNFSMSGGYENWNTDQAGYSGTDGDRRKLNLEATYTASADFAIYGSLNRSKDNNAEVRVPLEELLALPLDDPDYRDIRQAAAGQGYNRRLTTTNLGAWYALNSKLTIDGNIGEAKTGANAQWIIGLTPGSALNLAPDFAPYDARDRIWSTGLTYTPAPALRLYGRLLRSNSRGRTLVSVIPETPDPADPGPTWTPVRVTQNLYTFGLGYGVSKTDELLLDFSTSDWRDGIDSSQNGRFGIWRLAWSHRY